MKNEEIQKHLEILLHDSDGDEDEDEGLDYEDDSLDDYIPPEQKSTSSSSNASTSFKAGQVSAKCEASDAEEEMILEEDDIRDDEQEEGVLFEADFSNDDNFVNTTNWYQKPDVLLAKDGTAWLTDLGNKKVRKSVHNVFRGNRVGPSRATKGLIEASVFDLIFNSSMLEEILEHTNNKAERVFKQWNQDNPTAKKRVWNKISYIEMKAFIGLLFLMGVNKSSDEDIDVLWGTEAVCYYRATMSKSRFKEILRFIRFDDQITRNARLINDKAAPISSLWTQMNKNLRKCYHPSGEITVDEQLFSYRGRTRFTQYIPSKPAKYGIKVWFACDANTYYPLNSEIYTGKNWNAKRAINVGESVVQKLVHPWENTGRTIVCDNFFTSLNLAKHLMSKGLAILGTVRQNKTFVPIEMKPDRKRIEGSTIFGFFESKFALASYVPKKGKSVILLSTTPLTNEIVSEQKNKPQYILDYNATKGGVDVMDKMLCTYSTKRKTLRWPLAMFFNLLDVSALAAFIIYVENNDYIHRKDKRRQFLRSLSKQLVMPAIEQRAEIPRVLGSIQTRLAIKMSLAGCTTTETETETVTTCMPDISKDIQPKNPVRCAYCRSGKRKMTRKICSWCKKPVCDSHAVTYTFGECCSTKQK